MGVYINIKFQKFCHRVILMGGYIRGNTVMIIFKQCEWAPSCRSSSLWGVNGNDVFVNGFSFGIDEKSGVKS